MSLPWNYIWFPRNRIEIRRTLSFGLFRLWDLRQGLEGLLKKKIAPIYVQKLLNEANRLFGGDYPHINTISEDFTKIINRIPTAQEIASAQARYELANLRVFVQSLADTGTTTVGS